MGDENKMSLGTGVGMLSLLTTGLAMFSIGMFGHRRVRIGIGPLRFTYRMSKTHRSFLLAEDRFGFTLILGFVPTNDRDAEPIDIEEWRVELQERPGITDVKTRSGDVFGVPGSFVSFTEQQEDGTEFTTGAQVHKGGISYEVLLSGPPAQADEIGKRFEEICKDISLAGAVAKPYPDEVVFRIGAMRMQFQGPWKSCSWYFSDDVPADAEPESQPEFVRLNFYDEGRSGAEEDLAAHPGAGVLGLTPAASSTVRTYRREIAGIPASDARWERTDDTGAVHYCRSVLLSHSAFSCRFDADADEKRKYTACERIDRLLKSARLLPDDQEEKALPVMRDKRIVDDGPDEPDPERLRVIADKIADARAELERAAGEMVAGVAHANTTMGRLSTHHHLDSLRANLQSIHALARGGKMPAGAAWRAAVTAAVRRELTKKLAAPPALTHVYLSPDGCTLEAYYSQNLDLYFAEQFALDLQGELAPDCTPSLRGTVRVGPPDPNTESTLLWARED